MSDFRGGYRHASADLRKHLAVYDDHGREAFAQASRTDRSAGEQGGPRATAVYFSRYGIDVAPEKPEVYDDRRCREPRTRALGRRTLYCHWHGKLAPDRNRVHLHEPVPESAGSVIVAIFHEHLPLPGD